MMLMAMVNMDIGAYQGLTAARCWPTCRHLHKHGLTDLVLPLQSVPVLDDHLELLEDEAVGESVSARMVLDEVVLVRRALLDGPVDRNSHPESASKYQ